MRSRTTLAAIDAAAIESERWSPLTTVRTAQGSAGARLPSTSATSGAIRNAATARAEYKRAQRRNYPRGEARAQYLINEAEALDELAQVEASIEKLRAEGRAAGALPGWVYEVDEEPIGRPQPAARDEREDPQDREGRNPLYLDSE